MSVNIHGGFDIRMSQFILIFVSKMPWLQTLWNNGYVVIYGRSLSFTFLCPGCLDCKFVFYSNGEIIPHDDARGLETAEIVADTTSSILFPPLASPPTLMVKIKKTETAKSNLQILSLLISYFYQVIHWLIGWSKIYYSINCVGLIIVIPYSPCGLSPWNALASFSTASSISS